MPTGRISWPDADALFSPSSANICMYRFVASIWGASQIAPCGPNELTWRRVVLHWALTLRRSFPWMERPH